MKQKGFTLIELLVVIAIIAVLAGALLIAINPQSMIQKGRDSKRLQDMDTLVKAINLALADSEILLLATDEPGVSTGSLAVDCSGWVTCTQVPTVADPNTMKPGLAKFLSTLPADPLNTGNFVYTYASDGTNFEVNAVLEHTDNTTKMSTDGGNADAVYEMGSSLTII